MLLAVVLLAALTTVAHAALNQPLPAFPPVTPADRIVIIAPHPDDDILGTGGLIQQANAVGADVRVIYLTSGDHNQIAFKLYQHTPVLWARQYRALGEKRHTEAINAAREIGLAADRLTFLGYPDWFTLRIWTSHWSDVPARSDATRTNAVPYPACYSHGHTYTAPNITADLFALFRQFRPTRVFVPHPADTNPDHRAAANFARLAVLQMAETGFAPDLYHYVVHFGAWPRPLHYRPDAELVPPRALRDDGDWMSLRLLPAQTVAKHRSILQHRTQLTTRQYYLTAFARANELFATISPGLVPWLPGTAQPDWRIARRVKAIGVSRTEPTEDDTADITVRDIADLGFIRHNGDLLALIELRNWFGRRTGVQLFLYGYQEGRDFAAMPKVRVIVPPVGSLQVRVDGQRVANPGVSLVTTGNRLVLRVPLTLLGGPEVDHVFTAARAKLGEIAADDTAWQLLQLRVPGEKLFAYD